jgi:hypothetical protein
VESRPSKIWEVEYHSQIHHLWRLLWLQNEERINKGDSGQNHETIEVSKWKMMWVGSKQWGEDSFKTCSEDKKEWFWWRLRCGEVGRVKGTENSSEE